MNDQNSSGSRPNPDLNVSRSDPVEVPVFNCIVYVSAQPEGGVRVRVANLEGLEFIAGDERQALAKVVSAFKEKVSGLIQSKSTIPWIEPPIELQAGEQRRFVPIHL